MKNLVGIVLVGMYQSYYYKKSTDGTPAKPMFRYLLSGSEESVNAYVKNLEDRGVPAHRDEETNKVIFFTGNPQGNKIDVLITPNGKIVTKDDEIAGLTALLQQETDPTLKNHFASEIANVKIARMRTMLAPSKQVASNTAGTVPAQAPVAGQEPDMTVEANQADLAG